MKLALACSLILLAEASAAHVRRAEANDCMTLSKLACHTDGFSTLCGLLKSTGLSDVLDGDDEYTVFAPTDEAFAMIGVSLADLDAEALTDLLLFHVTPGTVLSGDLTCKDAITMANGKDSRTKCEQNGAVKYQAGGGNADMPPMIVAPDVAACNGVAHVIDHVMLYKNLPPTCDSKGFSKFPFLGQENSQRLLLRNGVIDEIPPQLCPKDREGATSKNVILVVGDGMGWEMVRAGAIAKRVIAELGELGCDAVSGECPDDLKEAAKAAFAGRTTADYYTEGAGSGLSFQDALDFMVMTPTTVVIGEPNPGNHYAPSTSLLNGTVTDHKPGQAPLALNECGFPIDFSPLDFMTEGGNMVLWDDKLGGEFPWDERYYQEYPDTSTGFDPLYIMQHATDSAPTASCMATGHKASVDMLSQNLYEEEVSTLVEDAMFCGKAGGVVTTVPMFHATPGAFILHSNYRSDRDQLRRSFEKVNPTFVSGVCGGDYYPYPETLERMRSGSLSSQWTLLEQNNATMAEDFYAGEKFTGLDPDNGDHVMVCLGGDWSPSGQDNLPYRGVDSSYTHRVCSGGEEILDPDTGIAIGVNATGTICNHYTPEEVAQIPHITENVKAALDFLSKDDDGFFMMYEQGDIDWAAHENHMDDLLGAMLDLDESVQVILDWIAENGGFEKNAIYVTADHDHYLTLLDHFPEALANLMIDGRSYLITPASNSNVNPWDAAIAVGRHDDDSKNQTEDLKDFSTWSDEEVMAVGHFWGPFGSGGNGWGSHSTRPVALYHGGDDGCLEALVGAGFQVVGREVKGSPGKVDQMHLHACMQKQMLGF